MLDVDFVTDCPDPLWRQLPGGDHEHAGCRYRLRPAEPRGDVCVVYHDVPEPVTVESRHGLIVLVTIEPEILTSFYPPAFLKQFDAVLTFRRDLKHPHVVVAPPMIPWWVGVSGGHDAERRVNLVYEDLQRPVPDHEKTRGCSVICSSLAHTPTHRARLSFVDELCERLPAIDRYGFGHRPVQDKWEALQHYRAHVAIENSSCPDYWTEKAGDAFLSESFLIYAGCPNLEDYFPPEAFARVDLNDVEAAVALVERVSDPGFYAERRDAIREAKRLVLEKYNLFTDLAGRLRSLERRPACRRRVCPQSWYRGSLRKRIRRRLRSRFQRAASS